MGSPMMDPLSDELGYMAAAGLGRSLTDEEEKRLRQKLAEVAEETIAAFFRNLRALDAACRR